MTLMNPEKLAKLQEQVRIGGKGTPRRKVKKTPTQAVTHDDRKLMSAMGKLRATPIPAIAEVNMFDEDGKVIHFQAPKVIGSVPGNTFVIQGRGEEKELTELLPGILGQLGAESLDALRRMAQAMQANGGQLGEDNQLAGDSVPELVEEFAGAEIKEEEVDV